MHLFLPQQNQKLINNLSYLCRDDATTTDDIMNSRVHSSLVKVLIADAVLCEHYLENTGIV